MKYKINQQLVAINEIQFREDSFIRVKKGFGYKVVIVNKYSIVLKIGEYNVLLDKKDVNEIFVIYKGLAK